MKKSLSEIVIGSWSLIELIEIPLDGGAITHPMGRDANGLIIYSSDGYMSAQIMGTGSDNIDKMASSDSKNESILRNPAYLAYSGPFHIDEQKHIVSHTLEVSLSEKWRYSVQNRKIFFEDGLMQLETEPFRNHSKLVIHQLTWKKK